MKLSISIVALAASALLAQTPSDPFKDLKAKEVEKRVAAVDALAKLPPDKSRKPIESALTDKDWEVVEHAARALGAVGDKSVIPELVELAVNGPIQRIRDAACTSLARIDGEHAVTALVPRTNGKLPVRAFEAIGKVAVASDAKIADASLLKVASATRKSKDPHLFVAAARTWIATSDPQSELSAWLAHPRLDCRAAALEVAVLKPDARTTWPLVEVFVQADVNPVVERRLIPALAASLVAFANQTDEHSAAASRKGALSEQVLALLEKPTDARTVARRMRLAAELFAAAKSENAQALRTTALGWIDSGLSHADAAVRAAAALAASRTADAKSMKRVLALAADDRSVRVRRTALELASRHFGWKDADAIAACAKRLADDADASVREEAAVLLGVEGLKGALEPLTHALGDKEWTVCAAAAVSLGKTRDASVLEPLNALAKDAEWRRRGAALVGLAHLYTPPTTPTFIQALADPEPALARLAHQFLMHASNQHFGPDVAAWQKWWDENQAHAVYVPPEELRARLEKYGYKDDDETTAKRDPKTASPNLTVAYSELDVVVFEGRIGGDNIQTLFDRLGVKHRMTAANKVAQDAIQPDGVYVANCPGEIEAKDVERLQWFVHVGGYLFSSCWSLHETIERVAPGWVKKFETQNEVVDDVPAESCVPDSPLLKGVFDPHGTPIYKLEGAHLIEVLDPERCEVLIDSPTCATKWGSGELAVWFRVGHGLVLDSVNHFDLQGLEVAPGLKTPEDRVQYAFDHMGLSYAEWRRTQGEKWWSSNSAAAKQVFDLSAFRFLTNFVRKKRIGDE